MATPDPLTDEQIAAIRARADAATPGPWKVDCDFPDAELFIRTVEPGDFGRPETICGYFGDPVDNRPWANANSQFIAATRTDVPALLTEVERARTEANLLQFSANSARIEMTRQLHIALHGETWARPETPAEVWAGLLAEVERLKAAARSLLTPHGEADYHISDECQYNGRCLEPDEHEAWHALLQVVYPGAISIPEPSSRA